MTQRHMEKKETSQSVKEVFSNNFFLLKLMFTASPSFILFTALDSVRNQVSIFFEHTVGIGYVLEAAEFNYPFKKVAAVILLLAACITLGMVFTVIAGDYISEKERPKVREKIKLMLYEKAKELEGATLPVLVEQVNEHDSTLLTGRLSNNSVVHFSCISDGESGETPHADESLIGRIVDVKLVECKGFYYLGEVANA